MLRTQEHQWTKQSKPLLSWSLHSNGKGPTLSDTLKKEFNDLMRGDKCYKHQKVEQNKRERRCQGWESGGGWCKLNSGHGRPFWEDRFEQRLERQERVAQAYTWAMNILGRGKSLCNSPRWHCPGLLGPSREPRMAWAENMSTRR